MRFNLLVALLGIAFASLYTAEGFLFRDYNLDEFQVATGYLKDREPALYPSDFIWAKPEMTRNLHVCVRRLMRATEAVTFGALHEPIDLFLVWLPVCMLFFYAGIYLLCLRFTGDRVASLLVACAFMLVRRTVWDWWGLGPTYTMSARGLAMALMPLMLWAYFRCRHNMGWLALCFLAWGLVSNLHPLGGWGLLEVLGIAILVSERFSPRAVAQVAVMGIATMIGSIPFIMVWTHVVVIPPELQADPAVVKSFWDGFMGLDPPPSRYFFQFLSDLIIPFVLSAAGYAWWWRHGRSGDKHEARLLALIPAVVLTTTVLVMVGGNLLRRAGFSLPVMVPEHCRNIKMVYLTLPVWMAFALAGWRQLFKVAPSWWRMGPPVLVIFLSMTLNFPGHKLARHLLVKAGWLPAAAIEEHQKSLLNDAADWDVAEWARKNTPANALFYFDSYEFRYYSRRSLVFGWFDRPCVGFRPTHELEEWIRRRDRVTPLKKARDGAGMLEAAGEYRADYLVVENSWKQPPAKPAWSNSKYSVYEIKRQ